ncbi:MAG: urease subunit beta [Isosphaeraceae bacterium]|jgi:urease subunit beta
MKPGEYYHDGPDLEINAGRPTVQLKVTNTGDRPVQVGSHFHFFEVNRALVFDREQAYGRRLDLLSGTAIRFEPGDVKEVQLVDFSGERKVYGLNGLVMGQLDDPTVRKAAFQRLKDGGFGDEPSK